MQSANTTALLSRLNLTQKEALARLCCERIGSVQDNLNELWRKRDNYLLQMEDRFEYRKGLAERDPERPTSIFNLQNDSINIVGGMAEFLSARTIDDIFGSGSWFSLQPRGINDKDLARVMQRHSEWRLDKSNFENVFSDAIAVAYALGEAPVKIIYDPKTMWSEQEKSILVDPTTGQFVQTPDDKLIFEDDAMTTVIVQPIAGTDAEGNPIASQELPTEQIFAKKCPDFDLAPFRSADGSFTYRRGYAFIDEPSGESLEAVNVHHRAFICSSTARSVQSADFVAQLFDLPLSIAKAKWHMDEETLAFISEETQDAKTAGDLPQRESGEQQETIPYDPEFRDPVVQFAECYITTVVAGRRTKLFVIVCTKARRIVYADYLANVTPKGIVPFFVLRPYPIRNRWHGRGFFEMYEYAQEFIERHLNYIAYHNRLHSNPAKIVRRDLIVGLADGEEFKIGPDTTLEVKSTQDADQIVKFIEFPDLDERTWQLMQMMIQMIQLRTGVTSAAQGGVDAVPQNTTATGIEAILSSGNVLSRRPIKQIKLALEDALFFSLKLIYSHLDKKETFSFLEGEEAQILEMDPERIRNLDFDIRLTLTKMRERETQERATQGIDGLMKYLLQIPEESKDAVRPMFVDFVRACGYDNAEQIVRRALPPPDPQGPSTQPL